MVQKKSLDIKILDVIKICVRGKTIRKTTV